VVLELSRKFGGWHDGGFKRCRGKSLRFMVTGKSDLP